MVPFATITISDGVEEEKVLADSGDPHRETRFIDVCDGGGEMGRSSVHVSPRRARFWVVAKTGMERMEAKRRSFWVVRILLFFMLVEEEGKGKERGKGKGGGGGGGGYMES